MDSLNTEQKVVEIISFLKLKKGVDFSGYRLAILQRRIQKRLFFTNTKNFTDYYTYLFETPEELDILFDVLALNVSHFFRNALTFETIRKNVIPDILTLKKIQNENSFRVWSAGCANGEEPYSLALILREMLDKKENNLLVNIFATDFDRKSLEKAKLGNYKPSYLENVKYGVLRKFFKTNGEFYSLADEVKEMVKFSFFDLVEGKNRFPSDSIFGGFDIVLCRNVLIYYGLETQKIIFSKLYRSLNKNGYLILGDAEFIPQDFKADFLRESNYCKIFRKIGE